MQSFINKEAVNLQQQFISNNWCDMSENWTK